MSSCTSKSLFLDFDGVLHPRSPSSSELMFAGVKYLETAITQEKDIGLVITSSWTILSKRF